MVIKMAQFLLFAIGTKPAPAPVCKFIDRRQQPCLAAELLGIFFCKMILFQKGHLLPGQAQQPFPLIMGDADILYCIRRQGPLVLAKGADLTIPLNITLSADGKRPQHPFLWAAGDRPCEQIYIGFLHAQDTHLHPHPLQLWNGGMIDKVPVFRHLT